MATGGAAAKDQFSQAQSLAAQQQQTAVQAAADRAQAIGAPSPFSADLQSQVSNAYGDAGLSLAARHQANQREGQAVQGATGNYLGQLKAALPIIQSKQQIAMQQILADSADKKAQRDYQQRELAYNNKKLDLETAKLTGASGTEADYTAPLSTGAAAKNIGLTLDQAKSTMASPAYLDGRLKVNEALKEKLSFDELRAALTSPDATGTYLGGVATPPDPAVIALLTETYRPAFKTAQDISAEKAAAQAAAKGQAFDIVGGKPASAITPAEQAAAVSKPTQRPLQGAELAKFNALLSALQSENSAKSATPAGKIAKSEADFLKAMANKKKKK
jgi:hypothetical protein